VTLFLNISEITCFLAPWR